ncbi:hypothetical protein EJ05DRAFT_260503 [Pseudovirgaria hyperparasitica]|uniref:Uncharacterized protein n=1 Tax=Pseudovirgaria hyperparasitica TaxID=470096 RepID=A0A6A6WI77_9PEZI|nr:uncharacterized protein EJ05DRAFT_260503 [Pseudovirgaria hyperparasitica]KAF2761357.1 hypothetical protein EJ05DRAFT_260503 [Pseudovirgaria hyperparasitica]
MRDRCGGSRFLDDSLCSLLQVTSLCIMQSGKLSGTVPFDATLRAFSFAYIEVSRSGYQSKRLTRLKIDWECPCRWRSSPAAFQDFDCMQELYAYTIILGRGMLDALFARRLCSKEISHTHSYYVLRLESITASFMELCMNGSGSDCTRLDSIETCVRVLILYERHWYSS